jgi:hypothetical protein
MSSSPAVERIVQYIRTGRGRVLESDMEYFPAVSVAFQRASTSVPQDRRHDQLVDWYNELYFGIGVRERLEQEDGWEFGKVRKSRKSRKVGKSRKVRKSRKNRK